jgi:Tfp pilus assembly protein PilE
VQNAIAGGTDRASTARALLRGKSLTSFEASIEESRRNNDEEDGVIGAPLPTDVVVVDAALTVVATTVFPHRALEIQRLWMNRGMRKPYELTTRKTAAASMRINNALPLFPGGTEASKFSNAKVIGLLKWSLPPSWRSKFDLDGYIPTLDTKAKLIENCEAIERNQTDTQQAKPTHKGTKKKSEKSQNSTGKRESGTNNSYCLEHGKNSKHSNTSDCFTLKNRKDNGQNGDEKNGKTVGRSFYNRNFRKELNAMAKKSSKKEVLDLYASAIAREQTKYGKASKKKASVKRKVLLSESEEDSIVTLMNLFT